MSKQKAIKAKQNKASGQEAIAAIRYAESEPSQDYAQELSAIESDEKLQAILAKQEDDIALTEQEVNYFNDMMERHQQLTEQLGIDDEEDDIDSVPSKKSADDLWDKLDNAGDDFSEFE
jgi:ribosome assembly protein YihI (activator of Der GTPase)